MDEMALLADLHRRQDRQGPGGDDQTRLALTLSGLIGQRNLRIADMGCGTGASTLILAQELDAVIDAVDFLPPFLEELMRRAEQQGVADRIRPVAASMDEPPFEEGSLDAIWAEGAIYNLGFEAGVRDWRRLLKPGGVLAVSELTWLTAERPRELDEHWAREYPEVALASVKIGQLEAHGYTPIGYFPLPRACWLDHYYEPLEAQFEPFAARHGGGPAVEAILAAERQEIDLFKRFAPHISYGFYIARKDED